MPHHSIRFEVLDGKLVRHVTLGNGRSYTQRANLTALVEVARFFEDHREAVTTNQLWAALPEVPNTQVSVALEFLKERGCLETHCRKSYVATTTILEDALTEYYALAEEPAGRSLVN